jgi:cytochrome c oxidase subunit 2
LAHAAVPMNYLTSSGPQASDIKDLTWAVLGLSVFVVIVICVLVVVGIARRRAEPAGGEVRLQPLLHAGSGLSWIYIGVGLSVLALLGAMIWTGFTMAAIRWPPKDPKLTVEVIGHQWWWQVRYVDKENQSRIFETANEIHIPVGEPVEFKVTTDDVIHSFWVPQLGGKMDLIPNQINFTWLQASEPGTYRGQCSEFCGRQHAHMALLVVADKPDDFQRWWETQLRPAALTHADAVGATLFRARCGACHTVRGTGAGGRLGPDLTHVASRKTLGAGTLPNTIAYLSGWVIDPQTVKPGNLMPTLDLSGWELDKIRGFLEAQK